MKIETWKQGKNGGKLPKNAVTGDEKEGCKAWVASYYDSYDSTDRFTVVRDEKGNKIVAAQVDASGTAFYTERTNWYRAYDKYLLLVTEDIVEYEILDITCEEPKKTKQSDKHSTPQLHCNHLKKEGTYHSSLDYQTTSELTVTHSISWTVGQSFKFTGGIAVPGLAKAETELTTSFGFGGQHSWGKSLGKKSKATAKVISTVPPGHCIQVYLSASSMKTNLDCVAKVKAKYSDGTSRIVEDETKMRGVFYTNLKTVTKGPSCAIVNGTEVEYFTGKGLCEEEPTKVSK